MQTIYNDGTYLSHNPNWNAEDAPFKAKKILDVLKEKKDAVKTVCEVGCGSGEVLVCLSRELPHASEFRGFDISKDAIRIAKSKETGNIHFKLADFTQSAEKTKYDLLLVIDVIEHLENYFEFIRRIRFRSKYTVFHIPLDMSVWTLFREKMLLESKERVGHIHNFTEDFIKDILTDFGYKILNRLYTEPVFKPEGLKQKFVETLRKLLFKLNKRFCSKTMGGVSIMLLAENPSAEE